MLLQRKTGARQMGQKGGEVMLQENKTPTTFELLMELQRRRAVFKDRPEMEIWMTADEAADFLDKARFTVSEWCRLGKIHARKLRSGRWQISIAEIERYLRDGFLPVKSKYRYVR